MSATNLGRDEIECICGNWSDRELRRQVASLYHERNGLSQNKDRLSAMTRTKAGILQPAQIIRDPFRSAPDNRVAGNAIDRESSRHGSRDVG